MKVRVVNVRPVVLAFHGYPWLMHNV